MTSGSAVVSVSAFNPKTDNETATIPKIKSLRNWTVLAMRVSNDSITVGLQGSATVVFALFGWMRSAAQAAMQFERCLQKRYIQYKNFTSNIKKAL
jgi:hypothetical protein